MLIVVREGAVVLEGTDSSVLLHEGDGCLIPPGDFHLTEIPRCHLSRGEVLLYFFDDRVLADLLKNTEGIDEIVARISLPPLPFYPARNLVSHVEAALASNFIKSRDGLTDVFKCLIASGGSLPFAFLKRFFGRRLKLFIFLENCIGAVDPEVVEKRYLEGVKAFRRECSVYLGSTVNQWLFRHRLELAHDWIRYSKQSAYEVASALDYNIQQLRGDIRRWYGISIDDLETLQLLCPIERDLPRLCLPSWLPSVESRNLRSRRRMDDSFWIITMTAHHGNLKNWSKKYRSPALTECAPMNGVSPSPENFLEFRTTKISDTINVEAVEQWQTGTPLFSDPKFRLAA